MTLITRISRLFRADFNALLDHIEEPDVLLRQAIREMEEDLDEGGRRLEALRREAVQLAAREAELNKALANFEDELNLCFAAGKDELARALVRRKLESQRALQAVAKKLENLATRRAELETRQQENKARLESVRQQAEALAESIPAHPAESRLAAAEFNPREEEVEVAFLREKQKRSQP